MCAVDWLLTFQDPENPEFSLVFEDDGYVAYAYFRENEEISGLVWLYNGPKVDLREKEREEDPGLPPGMPRENVKEPSFVPVLNEEDIEVDWVSHGDRRDAVVYIRSYIHAVVSNGEYPGACRIALRDSEWASAWDIKV